MAEPSCPTNRSYWLLTRTTRTALARLRKKGHTIKRFKRAGVKN
jgi:hypothetical protein